MTTTTMIVVRSTPDGDDTPSRNPRVDSMTGRGGNDRLLGSGSGDRLTVAVQ
jgi:hypothetical protein